MKQLSQNIEEMIQINKIVDMIQSSDEEMFELGMKIYNEVYEKESSGWITEGKEWAIRKLLIRVYHLGLESIEPFKHQ